MDDHEIIRAMIQHENELVNHRFTWFGAFQGFLFAALAFAWEKGKELVPAFCFLGMMVALLSWISLVMATVGVNRLVNWWATHKKGYSGPPVWGVIKDGTNFWGFLTPWLLTPLVFLGGWIALLYLNNQR